MIIEHTIKNTSGALVEHIEENICHRNGVNSIKVERFNVHNDYLITIDVDSKFAFDIGLLIGHYELALTHSIIIPRNVKIYGKTYKKDYPHKII